MKGFKWVVIALKFFVIVIILNWNPIVAEMGKSSFTEEDCGICHEIVLHHELGIEDCRICHPDFQRISDCMICHSSVIHHENLGEHQQFDCLACHNGQTIIDENTCYQCHNDPENSVNGINIYAKFTDSNDMYGGLGIKRDYYDTVNAHHDISDEDQAYSSTKIECTNCHNAHLATSVNMLINPADRWTPFTQTIIHPASGETVVDSITFCLECHDNTWAADQTVTGPNIIKNIAAAYLEYASKSDDEHGAASGSGKSILQGPYAGSTSSGIPSMPCTDCHDAHGGDGIYHLKTLTDQYGEPVTITSENIGDHIVAHWCSHCHNNPMNQLDGKKKNCISSSCHSHGSGSL